MKGREMLRKMKEQITNTEIKYEMRKQAKYLKEFKIMIVRSNREIQESIKRTRKRANEAQARQRGLQCEIKMPEELTGKNMRNNGKNGGNNFWMNK